MRTGNKAPIVLCICQLPEPAALAMASSGPHFRSSSKNWPCR